MKLEDFTEKSEFLSLARVIVPKEDDEILALASLQALRGTVPDGLDPSEDPDLLYIGGPSFVANMRNKNGDAITGLDSLEVGPKFKNKYIDIEHDQKRVIGNVLYHSYSQYASNGKILTPEEISLNPLEVFNVNSVGYIWRFLNKQLAKLLIEASDLNSPRFGVASFSWELLLKNYDIAVGSPYLKDAEIIADEKIKKELMPFLINKGGEGKRNGEFVYRVIKPPILPTGLGIVRTPAAAVDPITVDLFTIEEPEAQVVEITSQQEASCDEDKPKETVASETITSSQEITSESEEKNIANQSQEKNSGVTDIITQKLNISKVMPKFKKVEDLYSYLQENLSEEASASAKDFVKKHLEEFASEYESKADQAEASRKEIEAAKLEIESKVQELSQSKASLEAELNELKTKVLAHEQEKRFGVRMEEIDAEFDFSDDERKAVASQVRELSDEAFASWKEGTLKVLAKEKSKEYKKLKAEKEKQEAEAAQASAQTTEEEAAVIEAALASAQETSGTPPNSATVAESISDKWAKAFSDESVTIS